MKRTWIILLPLALGACSGRAETLPGPGSAATFRQLPPPEPKVRANLADGLDLDEAIALAMANNPRFQAARLGTKLAEARRVTAGTYPHNPEAGFETGGALPFGSAEDFLARLWLSQTIELGGKGTYRIAVADADLARSTHAIENAKRLLRASVAARFYEVLFHQQLEAMAERNLELAGRIRDVSEERLRARQIAEVETNLVRLDLGRAGARRKEAARETQLARVKLAALLGRPTLREFVAKGNLGAIVVIPDRRRLRETAMEARPDLREARASLRVTEEQIRLVASQAVPDVNVGIFAERESTRLDAPGGSISESDMLIGIELSIPLPIFNTRRGERLEAEIERRRVEFQLDGVKQDIQSDVELAVARLEAARAVVESYEKDLNRLAQQNVADMERAYQAGEVGTLAVFRAQEDLNRVTENHLRAQFGLRLALAEIEAAVGTKLSQVK